MKLNATLFEEGSWLQHATDTSNSSESFSCRDYWLTETMQQWPSECCLCESAPATLGAHVVSVRRNKAGMFIVPACATCNSNNPKTVKYAEVKFNVWAARVSDREIKRIECRQRATARHQSTEAQAVLIRTLPKAGVPVPIHAAAAAAAAAEPEPRVATPLPPSPLSDPDVLDFGAPPPLVRRNSVEFHDDGGGTDRLAGFLADALRLDGAKSRLLRHLTDSKAKAVDSGSDSDAATPPPMRRRDRSKLSDAMQQVHRCKEPVKNGTCFCNSLVCAKVSCPGSSKVYCCDHCHCRNCKKSGSSATIK